MRLTSRTGAADFGGGYAILMDPRPTDRPVGSFCVLTAGRADRKVRSDTLLKDGRERKSPARKRGRYASSRAVSGGAVRCGVSGSRNQQRSGGNSRRRQGHVGRGHARRAGRSVEPGADRENALGRHRRRGPVQDCRSESGHLPGRVHARRVQDGAPRQHRPGGQLHPDGERRAPGRLGRGDAHRHRRIADRRPRQQHHGVRREPRRARRDSRSRRATRRRARCSFPGRR